MIKLMFSNLDIRLPNLCPSDVACGRFLFPIIKELLVRHTKSLCVWRDHRIFTPDENETYFRSNYIMHEVLLK